MDNTIAWAMMAILLIVGAIGGFVIAPDAIEVPGKDVPGEPYPVPGETIEIIKEVPAESITVEVKVPAESLYLDTAFEDLFEEYDRDSDWLSCDEFEYDDDEVEHTTVYGWSYGWMDDDMFEITGEFKFKADDDSEERACKETRYFSVLYEEGEDPEFEWSREGPVTH